MWLMTIPNSNVLFSHRMSPLVLSSPRAKPWLSSILLIQCRLLRKSKINISSNCNLVRNFTKHLRWGWNEERSKLLLFKWKIICNKAEWKKVAKILNCHKRQAFFLYFYLQIQWSQKAGKYQFSHPLPCSFQTKYVSLVRE